MTNLELKLFLLERANCNTEFVQKLQALDDKYSKQRMEWLKHSTRLVKASMSIPQC